MSNDTYVFNGCEVKLTGRTASKKTSVKSRRNGETSDVVDELVEVTPSNLEEGSWKQWIKLEELFIIGKK